MTPHTLASCSTCSGYVLPLLFSTGRGPATEYLARTVLRHFYSLANMKINEYGPVRKEYHTGTRFLFLLFLITMKMFTGPYPVIPTAVHKVQQKV
jgi:hypothetical protein